MKFLFENFDILAQAPGGVKKLREMILQFAVQGKLVPQNPNDEPAGVLLEKIKEEKARLIKEGKIKKEKPLLPVEPNEVPYNLLKRWALARLQEISVKITDGEHLSPKKTTSGVFLLTAKHVTDFGVITDDPQYVSEDDAKRFRDRCDPEKGDLLICSRGTIGRCTVVDIDYYFCLMGSVILIKPSNFIVSDYLMYLLRTNWAQRWMLHSSGATAVKALYLKDIKNCPIPLPPLAEQKRIVAKVDSLMALCDDLEKQQQEKAKKKLAFNKASLHALNNSKTKPDFNKNWDHITKNFDLLYSTPANVNDLKQTILQLAVQGKLVPQNPNDEPASVLLEKIKEEKERLVKEGKIKKQKPFVPIREDEIPFDLPEGWEVTKIGAICNINMGQSPPGNTYNNQKMGIPLINGPVEFTPGPFGKTIRRQHTTKPTKLCSKGDFLLCVRGSTTGRTNIADFDACIGRGVAALHSFIHFDFFNWYMVSIREKLYNSGTGSTFKNISYEIIAKTSFVLPPLAEQKRIVAKVDSLMALCDRLSKSLADKETKSEKMLNAVVNQL